jgi:hypothetical protein
VFRAMVCALAFRVVPLSQSENNFVLTVVQSARRTSVCVRVSAFIKRPLATMKQVVILDVIADD